MRKVILIIIPFILYACTNLMDAEVTSRSTFIKLYNGTFGIEAAALTVTPDGGALIVGTMKTDIDSSFYTLAFRVDKEGNRTSDIKYYLGYRGFGAKSVLKSPTDNGFLLIGDRLSRNPQREIIDNIDIFLSLVLPIGNDLQPGSPVYRADSVSPIGTPRVDYSANAATVNSNGDIIVLGTYQKSNADPVRPYLRAYSGDFSTVRWTQDFESEERSYNNTKSLHYNSGSVIWASSIKVNQGGLNYAYTTVPNVQEGSVFINNSRVGDNTEMVEANDIQPTKNASFGYGVIGTRSNSDGTLSNMFFLKTDVNGNIIDSIRYYDAVKTAGDTAVTKTTSSVQDFGTAIAPTSDGGFVLAGHYITSNQTSDILLIKVDAFGRKVWLKTMGGAGSETVRSIKETSDRGLLILGTHTINGISSIFLMKTDKNGELKN